MSSKRHNVMRAWAVLLMALLFLAGCAVKKNTALTRAHHILNTRYNVNFNARTSYTEGLKKIEKSNQDDYGTVIPLYPISNHESAKAATSEMDRVIEKSRKAIKLHSIQKKPKKNTKKWSDPKYKAWYNQEEFNSQLDEAWLLLGQAEFHKADFMGAIGDFNYVQRHYKDDIDMQTRCQLWTARSYAEMGWTYEAEDLMGRINQDAMGKKTSALYSAFMADLLIKNKQYTKAVPYLKLALASEKRSGYRARFLFVLAQCQALSDQKADAIENYTKVIKANSEDLKLDFNARLNRARLQGDEKAQKQLRRMSRDYKYKDQLETIYGTMGDIALDQKDTAKALELYEKALEEATQASVDKANVEVRAADLYYQQHVYEKAQPLYAEAATLLSNTSSDYERVGKRSETLSLLITELQTIQLQDSLQHLSTLTEEEQLAVIEKMLSQKAAADSLAQAKQQQQQSSQSGMRSVNATNMIGGPGGRAEWYFYNENLKRQGKQTFAQKWGSRPLEDNWRYATKVSVTVFGGNEDEGGIDDLIAGNDSTQKSDSIITDPTDPRYYLTQIPKTEKDFEQSNAAIAGALFNAAYIYKDKIEDLPMAWATFDELKRRFPNDAHILDSYYTRYLQALRDSDQNEMGKWRDAIISEFPESSEAKMVSDPNYATRIRQMLVEQDSLYELTYNAYKKGQYAQVKSLADKAQEEYPLSTLIPKFLYLRSMAVAKTQSKQDFANALHDLVDRYPNADVTPMAKDMLAMMNLGRENTKGGSSTTLTEKRAEESKQDEANQATEDFALDLGTQFCLYVVTDSTSQVNELLYQVATYNFTQFMIKDFDLRVVKLNGEHMALCISGFETYSECEWYQKKINADNDLTALFALLNAVQVPISQSNAALLTTRTIEEYIEWWTK